MKLYSFKRARRDDAAFSPTRFHLLRIMFRIHLLSNDQIRGIPIYRI